MTCRHLFSRKSGVFEHTKTPQSRKLPGRKTVVSRKPNWKLFLMFGVSVQDLSARIIAFYVFSQKTQLELARIKKPAVPEGPWKENRVFLEA